MHLRNWRLQRLQIWCKGWMCKSQPTDDKLYLIGAWSGHVTHYKILWLQSYHWNAWTQSHLILYTSRQYQFYATGWHITNKRAWLWSHDCFKILPLVVMQCDTRVYQRQLSYLLHMALPVISSLQVIVDISNLICGLNVANPSLRMTKRPWNGRGHVTTHFKTFSPLKISLERLKLETLNFVCMLIIWSPSLRVTNCPWKGRGYCHVTSLIFWKISDNIVKTVRDSLIVSVKFE